MTTDNVTWDQIVAMVALHAGSSNDCEGCLGGIPGTIAPIATNGDDSHPFVERCDTCQRFETDWEAALRVAGLIGLVARRRYDAPGVPYFRPFLARPKSPDDSNFYCIDADEFGTHPRDEVPCP